MEIATQTARAMALDGTRFKMVLSLAVAGKSRALPPRQSTYHERRHCGDGGIAIVPIDGRRLAPNLGALCRERWDLPSQWPGRGSNPHGPCGPGDFKSPASANSATGPAGRNYHS